MNKKLLFIMVILLLQSCKENGPTEVREEALCKLEGKVYAEYDGTLTSLEGAKVKLDSVSSYTNSKGEFIFKNLSPGMYGIQIEKEGYETISDSVTIRDTTKYAEYYINCLLVDFLPLDMGRQWNYNYNVRYDDWQGFTTHSGIDEWKIVSRYDSLNIKIFTVSEISDYVNHYHDNWTGYDTTWNTIDTSIFAFKEYPDSTILVDRAFYNELPHIPRYSFRTDSISFGNFRLGIDLKPEKGIIRMVRFSRHGTLGVDEEYTLLEEE